MSSPTLRDATTSDLDAINAIYNHYVLNSTCTFQIAPESPDSRAAWFANRSPAHPVIVAESAGEIIAWGSLSPFHKREAFAATAENSIYVHHLHLRRGLGSLLLDALILRARSANLLSIVAAISAAIAASASAACLNRPLSIVSKHHTSMGFRYHNKCWFIQKRRSSFMCPKMKSMN